MERTRQPIKMGKPSCILTSDWHLREDTPTCFTGDFQLEQWEAVQTIYDLQAKYNCPILHAGDLFHHWKPSPWLLSKTIFFLPKQFYTIYGQHDLPQHNWELRDKSGIHTLEKAGSLRVLKGCHYGQQPDMDYYAEAEITGFTKRILVWHHMAYNVTPPYPGAPEGNAVGILRKYPQYDLIVTGDNHESFTVTLDGRRLVNPGNITRQSAKQIDFKPRVFLWYAEDNSVIPVYLPIAEDAISREHIDIKQEKEERLEAFMSHVSNDYEVEVSFENNLKAFFNTNDEEKDVEELVYKAID